MLTRSNAHGVEVVGMFFSEDNSVEERLIKVAKNKEILLIGSNQCYEERAIENGLVDGAVIGCFPDLYGALSDNMPN